MAGSGFLGGFCGVSAGEVSTETGTVPVSVDTSPADAGSGGALDLGWYARNAYGRRFVHSLNPAHPFKKLRPMA